MQKHASGLLAFLCACAPAFSADLKGKITDPSGAAIAGAQVAVTNGVGVVTRATSSASGVFEIDVPEGPDVRVVVAAAGFATVTALPAEAAAVRLELAPRTESVQV